MNERVKEGVNETVKEAVKEAVKELGLARDNLHRQSKQEKTGK